MFDGTLAVVLCASNAWAQRVVRETASTSLSDTVVGQYRTVPASGAPRVLASIRARALFKPGPNERVVSGPFMPRIVADVGVNLTVAHSNGAQYLVDIFPANGAPWRLEAEAPIRNVVQTDRDSVESRSQNAQSTERGSAAANYSAQFESMPKTFPPLANIRVLRDGTVWIKPTPENGAAFARWDVFSADGKRVGHARLLLSALVRDGAKDWVLVVQLNEDDVPMVVKYRVTPN